MDLGDCQCPDEIDDWIPWFSIYEGMVFDMRMRIIPKGIKLPAECLFECGS